MYPEDVARLFDAVAVGTPVTLINEPVKIARVDGEIWLEVHPPVDAQGQIAEPNIEEFERRLDELLGPTQTAIHWDLALAALREASGIPLVIGLEIPEDESSVPVPGEAPLEGASALPQEGVQGPAPESLPPAPDPVPVPALSDAPAPGPVAN